MANNLEAIFISDPKITESSASISVGVGSHMDRGTHGLAHLLEHMLFLGSKSFPKIGEFEEVLSKYSGSNNAFTEGEKTTYYFTVNSAGFERSLDIFSKMFYEPLLDQNYTMKEIEAVNSEFEKNLNSNEWKLNQLIKLFGNPLHPHNGFSTGNLESLNKTDSLNRNLNEMFNEYYFASNMKLTILTNSTLDSMQALAIKYFSLIKDKKTNINLYGNLQTKEPVFRKSDLGRAVWYKKSSGADLTIIFSIDSIFQHSKSKPWDYFSYLFRHSGDKSLFSFLKKRKLANKIDSGIYDSFKSFATFRIYVDLTKEGLNQVDFVIKLVFNFINLIKDSPVKKSIFEELQKIYQLNFKFKDLEKDYSSLTAKISNEMFDVDYRNILYDDYDLSVYNEDLIKNFLNNLNPRKAIVIIGSEDDNFPSDYISDGEANKEKWFKTEYLIDIIDESKLSALESFPVPFESSVNVDGGKSFKLRQKNEYISNFSDLVKDCRETKDSCELDEYDSKKGDLTPISYANDINFKVFYKIDKSFKLPKVAIVLKFMSEHFNKNPENNIYANILSNYLEYNLSFIVGDALETGNSMKITSTNDGIYVEIFAFSDIAEKLINAVSSEIFKFNPDSIIFEEIVEITRKNLNNIQKTSKPFYKNSYYFKKMVRPSYIHYSELLEILKKNKQNFHDFRTFLEQFKSEMVLTVFIYGSTEAEEVEKMVKDLRGYFPKRRLKETETLEKYNFQAMVGLHREINEMITLQVKNDEENQLNHAVTNYYQIGLRDYENILYWNIIDKCIGNLFYQILRTQEQLGYVVQSSLSTIDNAVVKYLNNNS